MRRSPIPARRAAAAAAATVLALAAPRFAAGQAESDAIIDEIRRMVGGLGGGSGQSPEALVQAELPRIEALAGMTAKQPVRVRMVSQDEAIAHVAATFDAQLPPVRRAQVETVYRALGFLAPDADLRDTVISLFGDQAGGFYDPGAGELVLLEEMPTMLQLPIIRHELVHALQDQNHDLSALIAAAQEDEDRSAALQAVLEGHAVDVMNRATLGAMGGGGLSPGDLSPGLAAELMETLGIEGDAGDAAAAASALLDLEVPTDSAAMAGLLPPGAPPALLAQLLFPYTVGADFVGGYRRAHPGDPGCAGLYRRLPRSSAEVLSPSIYTPGTLVPVFSKPGALLPGWTPVHSTALGRLLIWVLLTDQGDPSAGDPQGGRWGIADHDTDVALGRNWRGDRVALFVQGDAEPGSFVPGSYAVVWTSRWGDAAEAARVAEALRTRRKHATVVLTEDRVSAVFAGPAVHRSEMLRALRTWR